MRVYLPATLGLLARWVAAGVALVPGDGSADRGFAVTPALREWYREADIDELEYAAQVDASIGSLRLLAADPGVARRRVILAADLADEALRPDSLRGRAVVAVDGPIPISRWASALVDEPEAQATVAAAIDALGLADRGDDDARFAVDEAQAHELGWYAVSELRYLFD